jgi:hypothetical protein
MQVEDTRGMNNKNDNISDMNYHIKAADTGF